jgi:hypothetical protein
VKAACLLTAPILPRFVPQVDIMYWSAASVARITKYIAKGFECVVPAVRRDAFPDDQQIFVDRDWRGVWRGREMGFRSVGLGTLFDAEAEVLRSRAYWDRSPSDLQMSGEMVFPKRTGPAGSLHLPRPSDELELIIEPILGRLTRVEAATIASKAANKLGHGLDISLRSPRPRRRYDPE